MSKDASGIPDVDPSPEEKAFINEMTALSLTGILIRKGIVSVRMFSLGGGKTIVAYLLQETPDAHIVALPATLMGSGKGDIRAEFISPTPLVKFFKGGTPMMAMPTPTIFYHYLRLSRERFDNVPGYFNVDRKNQVDLLLEQLKQTHGDKLDDLAKEAKEKLSSKSGTPMDPDIAAAEAFIEQLRSGSGGSDGFDNFSINTPKTSKRYRH